MILYLIICSLLVPANIWAAITPHMHSDLSMRVLHGLSTLVLLPLLWGLWKQRRHLNLLSTIVLAVFALMLVLVNSWITMKGMPVNFGWLDHWLLALAMIAVVVFFLVAPAGEDYPEPYPTVLERTR